MDKRERIGILGGCFNPVHLGHLRAAVEAAEGLGLSRVDFVPAARPPHKPDAPMLGFELRVRLLRAAVADAPGFRINALEGGRPGPSYTWDTLSAYRAEAPGAELFFLMGAVDLLNLAGWKRGFELGALAHLAVMSREGLDLKRVAAFLAGPGAALGAASPTPDGGSDGDVRARAAWTLGGGHRLYFLEIPRLDISSSLLRGLWRRGGSLRYLTPDPVCRELDRARDAVDQAWGRDPGPGSLTT
ncbi:MAG: nicotinate (nicotinamide) nucleotide adenylyltransferase [Thermodesulfobacteriota bacterium]